MLLSHNSPERQVVILTIGQKLYRRICIRRNNFNWTRLVSHQFIFHYLVKVMKNQKISSPVYLLFTEKVNFLLVNKDKFLFKKKVNKQDSWFFPFPSLWPNNENELMRYIIYTYLSSYCILFKTNTHVEQENLFNRKI